MKLVRGLLSCIFLELFFDLFYVFLECDNNYIINVNHKNHHVGRIIVNARVGEVLFKADLE